MGTWAWADSIERWRQLVLRRVSPIWRGVGGVGLRDLARKDGNYRCVIGCYGGRGLRWSNIYLARVGGAILKSVPAIRYHGFKLLTDAPQGRTEVSNSTSPALAQR